MGINIFRKEFKKDKDDKTCQSEIKCFAQCYYNRIYRRKLLRLEDNHHRQHGKMPEFP